MRTIGPAALLVLALACERPAPGGERPSASSSGRPQKPNACAAGGGTVDDPSVSSFPREVGGFCIDPHADFRSYGEGEKAPLVAACEALEGDCASYARFGLRKVLVVPYVNAEDPRARVTVTLLELGSPEASYALYTERILGDSPDDFRAWKTIDAQATAVISGPKALAWRAGNLALLDYTDETSIPDRAAERGAAALRALARELVGRLPGKPDLPLSVALLPKRDAGPVAIRFEDGDLFGISSLGAGAVALYAPSGRNAPLAVLARSDDDAAKDVMKTFRRIPGSRAQRGAPYEATSVSIRDGERAPRMEWLFGRKRNVVLGIGREPEKLDRAARDRVRYAEQTRLKALLDGLRF